MIDAAQQRTNMVESQILTSDVTDKRILRAMGELPRERFVPPPWRRSPTWTRPWRCRRRRRGAGGAG